MGCTFRPEKGVTLPPPAEVQLACPPHLLLRLLFSVPPAALPCRSPTVNFYAPASFMPGSSRTSVIAGNHWCQGRKKEKGSYTVGGNAN